MKKLPTIQQARLPGYRSLGVLALIALLLTVSYLGTLGEQPVSATLPVERVPLDGTVAPTLEDIQPEPTAAPTAAPVAARTDTSFEAYRKDLEASRQTAAGLLDEVILNTASSAETVQEALRQKAALAHATEVETAIETLLRARGFADALCTAREGSVSVVIRGTALTQQQAAQILDIAVAESGEPATNVRVYSAQ